MDLKFVKHQLILLWLTFFFVLIIEFLKNYSKFYNNSDIRPLKYSNTEWNIPKPKSTAIKYEKQPWYTIRNEEVLVLELFLKEKVLVSSFPQISKRDAEFLRSPLRTSLKLMWLRKWNWLQLRTETGSNWPPGCSSNCPHSCL